LSEVQRARNEMIEMKREIGRLREEITTKRAEVAALND